ncbi:hypothetical protein GBA52_015455 [Prunus armeniaca]|nr:hypothetical protein GBA52_015455 [Prunus armeniaca]
MFWNQSRSLSPGLKKQAPYIGHTLGRAKRETRPGMKSTCWPGVRPFAHTRCGKLGVERTQRFPGHTTTIFEKNSHQPGDQEKVQATIGSRYSLRGNLSLKERVLALEREMFRQAQEQEQEQALKRGGGEADRQPDMTKGKNKVYILGEGSVAQVRAGPTPFSSRREVFIPEHTTILSRRTSSFQHQQQSPFILSVPHPRTLALNPYLANWLLF